MAIKVTRQHTISNYRSRVVAQKKKLLYDNISMAKLAHSHPHNPFVWAFITAGPIIINNMPNKNG
jgi:hypothetical protein